MAIPVVLDVDTGVDDACALLLAALHPGLDLKAVTCVDGNAGLDDVVRNTLTVLEVCGREDVPGGAGAARARAREGAPRGGAAGGGRGRGAGGAGSPRPDDEHRAAAAHLPGCRTRHRADGV